MKVSNLNNLFFLIAGNNQVHSHTPHLHIKEVVAGVVVGAEAVAEVVVVQTRVGTAMILGTDAGITRIDCFCNG